MNNNNNSGADFSKISQELVDDRLVYIQPYGDNEQLPMSRRAAKLSVYLHDVIELIDQNLFQDDVKSDDHNHPTIPLKHQSACNRKTMKNIIRWCEYHCDDPKIGEASVDDYDEDEYSKQTKLEELPSYWDRRFLADIAGDEDPVNGWQNRGDLYDLLIAAHFLQIQPIVEIGGKFICQAIKERNVEQVRNFLGIVNDMPEDEIRNILTDNDWAFSRYN